MTCVKSGFCCIQRPCPYGELSKTGLKECIYLSEPIEPFGQRPCMKYEEIKEAEKDSKFPMMGSGCSSQYFNDLRDAVIKEATK